MNLSKKQKIDLIADAVAECFGSLNPYSEGADVEAQSDAFLWEKFKTTISGILEEV